VTDQLGEAREPVATPVRSEPTTTEPAFVPLTAEERLGGPMTANGHRSPEQRRDRRRAAKEWIILVGIALIVAIVVRQFVFQLFYIPSGSMIPRLEIGDQVFVNKLAYDFGDPARGDLVVFERPDNWRDVNVKDLVKRIVGLPGETIEGRRGRVFINGKPLPEPYLPAGTDTSNFGPLTIPSDQYFMMGDNRSGSSDSRVHSPVDRDEFVGKVFLTVWPLDRISIPFWLIAVVVGGIVALIAIWIFTGRRQDLREQEPAP
jgi:signal peptidase I